jgi:hypothetical protein
MAAPFLPIPFWTTHFPRQRLRVSFSLASRLVLSFLVYIVMSPPVKVSHNATSKHETPSTLCIRPPFTKNSALAFTKDRTQQSPNHTHDHGVMTHLTPSQMFTMIVSKPAPSFVSFDDLEATIDSTGTARKLWGRIYEIGDELIARDTSLPLRLKAILTARHLPRSKQD